MRVFRLLVEDRQDGRYNMAVDHALLESMEQPDAEPVIRLYGFAPPTLTLGRFQKAADVLDLDAVRRDGLAVARRPTGGQAVLHDGELTYSVILSRRHVDVFSKRAVYRLVAALLMDTLGRMGLGRAGPGLDTAGERRGDLHNPDCFRTTGEYEIGWGGRKLVGSAQLVSRAGALQHGSILLDESNRRIVGYLRGAAAEGHESTSVLSLTGVSPGFSMFRDEVATHLEALVSTRRDVLRDGEKAAAGAALSSLYGNESWIFGERV